MRTAQWSARAHREEMSATVAWERLRNATRRERFNTVHFRQLDGTLVAMTNSPKTEENCAHFNESSITRGALRQPEVALRNPRKPVELTTDPATLLVQG